MTVATLLGWALLCLTGAVIAWGGIRRSSFWTALTALLCLLVLGSDALGTLRLLSLTMESYAMDVPQPARVVIYPWTLAALVAVWKFAPLWLLGRSRGT